METYEFSNIGVDRHYEELQPSDTSINTQFDTMELEDAEVSLNYSNYISPSVFIAFVVVGSLVVAVSLFRPFLSFRPCSFKRFVTHLIESLDLPEFGRS